jgi:hypothetical protein
MKQRWLPAALAAALLLTGCMARQNPHEHQSEQPMTQGPHEEVPVISIQDKPVSIAKLMEGKTGIVKMVATAQGFAPVDLNTTVGGKVRIHLVNQDSREHNLVIARYGVVTAPLAPGGETYIEFTASEKGAWPVVSDLPGTVEPGYEATLKVE